MSPKQVSSSVDSFMESLDEEHEQEERVREHRDSFFATAPDNETLVARAREFDDIAKHYVRREYWLATAQAVHKEKKVGLKLLTLPGRHRLEIEHYRKHGILNISADALTGEQELSVVGFETSPEVFGLLRTSNPRFHRLFQTDLVKTLAAPDSSHYSQLVKLFPFDIVNLDLTANLVSPKDGPYGPVLKAINECLKLQVGQSGQWALMLTFRVGQGDTDPSAIVELTKQFQENIDQHAQFKHACFEQHGLVVAQEIYDKNPYAALGQFAAKWITDQAHVHEWRIIDFKQVHYSREFKKEGKIGTYHIRKMVFRFQRGQMPKYAMPSKQLTLLPWYIEDLVRVAKSSSVDIDSRVENIGAQKPDFIKSLQEELENLKRAPNISESKVAAQSATSQADGYES